MKKNRKFILAEITNNIEKKVVIRDENAINRMLNLYDRYGSIYSVMRYINSDTLLMAYHSKYYVINEDGEYKISSIEKATGIDKVTIEEYGNNIYENIDNLLYRLKSNTYQMKPVRRVYIPKAPKKIIVNGIETIVIEDRPLSIISVEDSILQKVMVDEILVPIYEKIFINESFGYRDNKSTKDAIKYLEEINYKEDIKYILCLDNKAYFDSINRKFLGEMIFKTIKDRRFIKLIDSMMNTVYLDSKDGKYKSNDRGVMQGNIISPVLANIYLHYVMDIWYRGIETKESIYMIRYADDIVILSKNKEDIELVFRETKKRFKEYELEISEEKSEIVDLSKESITYLGYEIRKDGRNIIRYIAEKTLEKHQREISGIIRSAVSELDYYIKTGEIKQYLTKDMVKYSISYVRDINNKLDGLNKYYGDTKNIIVLERLVIFAKEEIERVWSNDNRLTPYINLAISKIISIDIFK